ncbi:hypothetical protein DIURU_002600 [Diutina rugosa]|uniref:Cleavage and polyadenylation specificity factor subunit 2 n=1 Tax=Diutina rugosa TaxID=5481 RepID=A0A642UPS3_DIURU|nr:uncharacterized protein DIURU_002600 [Diutina rugosa]KAA8902999.1 hypothetical protein DIURU_002600 [Diutina rugosa]
MFQFSLLSPSSSDTSFRAGKLTFDGDVSILADPSWNGVNPDVVAFLEPHLPHISAIVLSHSTPESVSGYVLLCIKFPQLMQQIPVYSTLPVNQLGRIATVEFYRARGVLGPLPSALVELDEVDEWWDRVTPLKYLQSTHLSEAKLTLTPFNAGHSLGGTFWVVTKRQEKIIYAPKWNHSKDSFLNSASWVSASTGNPLAQLLRPTAIITSTDVGSATAHKKRTDKFLALVDATIANGGAVVLPCTLSGRFLEIFHLVDAHLQDAPVPVPVYFLSYSGTRVLSYASNLLDWMAPSLLKQWQDVATMEGGSNRVPFDPSKVDLLPDPKDLQRHSGPKIVFCSGNDIANGDLSAEAFRYLAGNEKTTIILTERSANDDVSRMLYEQWVTLATQLNNGVVDDGVVVPFEKVLSTDQWTTEEPLSGTDLTRYQGKVHAHRKQRMEAKVRDRKNKNLLEGDMDDDEDSSEEEAELMDGLSDEEAAAEAEPASKDANGDASVATELASHEAFVTDHIKQAVDQGRALDLKVTAKLKPRQAMFPYIVPKKKYDDYGAIIDIRQFQKQEDNSQSQIINEGKRRFEEERGSGRGKGRHQRRNERDRLSPQEQLNQQIIKRYLDALAEPQQRVPLGQVTSANRQLRVRCGLSYVDLSGTTDLRSLSAIVASLKPYNVILLPDTTSADHQGLKDVDAAFKKLLETNTTEQDSSEPDTLGSRLLSLAAIRSSSGLSSTAATSQARMSVNAVMPTETITLGSGDDKGISVGQLELKLDEELVASLKWQNIDGSYRVAPVVGELELVSTNKRPAQIGDVVNAQTQFTLKRLKADDAAAKVSSRPAQLGGPRLAIGNVSLPELKKKLINRNLKAEFKSEGTLVVNDTIAVRKVAYSNSDSDNTGDIVIDGSMGPLYYEVKECIRDSLAYV